MTEHVTTGDTCDTFSGFAASRARAKQPTQKHVTPQPSGDTSDTFSIYQPRNARTRNSGYMSNRVTTRHPSPGREVTL